MKKYNVAIVGATGLVGRTILKVLEERNFPIQELHVFASKRSAGMRIPFDGKELIVEALTEDSFNRPLDFVLFSAGGGISKQFAPIARDSGAIVIDNSSGWRMDPNVPLIIPEVNGDDVLNHQGIISNPNCSTIQAVVPLGVLQAKNRIKRIVYSTYQAVSGSGTKGLIDLERGLEGKEPLNYPLPIAFNVLPHIDEFMNNGYTREEMKMIDESRKILGNPSLPITATTVRVPVRYGHSISVNVELEYPFDLEDIKASLKAREGIIVYDDLKYPTPLEVAGTDAVYIGRIRRDYSVPNGVNLWVVADNIRKGAATNTVQIAELLVRRGLR